MKALCGPIPSSMPFKTTQVESMKALHNVLFTFVVIKVQSFCLRVDTILYLLEIEIIDSTLLNSGDLGSQTISHTKGHLLDSFSTKLHVLINIIRSCINKGRPSKNWAKFLLAPFCPNHTTKAQ